MKNRPSPALSLRQHKQIMPKRSNLDDPGATETPSTALNEARNRQTGKLSEEMQSDRFSPEGSIEKYPFTDYVRCIAAIGVVVIHASGSYLYDINPADAPDDVRWWTANICSSLTRWATPFFILLSGSIFLRPSAEPEPTKTFLIKRLKRILPPFAVWGTVYLAYQYRGSFVGEGFPSPLQILNQIFFGEIYYHLWFIPMILGMYLLTPVFRIFIRHAQRGDVEYFLVCAFTMTALQHHVPNFFVSKYIGWLGYIGYYVLGYYLATYRLSERFKTVLFALALVATVVMAIGTWWFSVRDAKYNQMLYNYFSPGVVLVTVVFFTKLREVDWAAFARRFPRIDHSVRKFAWISFGIYFSHILVLDVLKNGYIGGLHTTSDLFFNLSVHPGIGVLLQVATATLISAGLILGLSRLTGWKKLLT